MFRTSKLIPAAALTAIAALSMAVAPANAATPAKHARPVAAKTVKAHPAAMHRTATRKPAKKVASRTAGKTKLAARTVSPKKARA